MIFSILFILIFQSAPTAWMNQENNTGRSILNQPKTLCLPIHRDPESPIHLALESLREELHQHADMIEVSCSQPDYQLYYQIDRSLDRKDDFILIISDVNIEISGGSERAIIYGLQELLRQLRNGRYLASSIRSVVSQPKVGTRTLQLKLDSLIKPSLANEFSWIDRMSFLHFNKLILVSDQPALEGQDRQALEAIRNRAKQKCIEVFFREFTIHDSLVKKGFKVEAGLVARSGPKLVDKSRKAIRFEDLRLERMGKYLSQTSVLIPCRNISEYFHLDQLQWKRYVDEQGTAPAEMILNYEGPSIFRSKNDTCDFLSRYHHYFSVWSTLLTSPKYRTRITPLLNCEKELDFQIDKHAMRISSLVCDLLPDRIWRVDPLTFEMNQLDQQPVFWNVALMSSDLFPSETGAGQDSSGALLDSLYKTHQELVQLLSEDTCTLLDASYLRRDAIELRDKTGYLVNKVQAAKFISIFSQSGKRSDRIMALKYMEKAIDFLIQWNQAVDDTFPNLDPRWLTKSEEDLVYIRHLRRP